MSVARHEASSAARYTARVSRLAVLALVALTVVAAAGLLEAPRGRLYADNRASGRQAVPQETPAPDPGFLAWLATFRQEALAAGISARVVEQALTGLEPLAVVLERDRAQAEVTQPVEQYLARRVDQKTVATARELARTHRALLQRVSARYGVQPRFLVAVWGLESNFGRFTGVRPTIAALATLAYDRRRSAYFRSELLDALRILDRGDIELARMTGSWAGAMGQPQFMPSNYLRYAEDFDGDGRRDIWTSLPDIFASMARFLSASGWSPAYTWGREVVVSKAAAARVREGVRQRTAGCEAMRQMSQQLPLARWQALGVRLPGGRPLPAVDLQASLVTAGTRRFLVYPNYDAILAYNCAHAYALSVGLLADRIGH